MVIETLWKQIPLKIDESKIFWHDQGFAIFWPPEVNLWLPRVELLVNHLVIHLHLMTRRIEGQILRQFRHIRVLHLRIIVR